MNRTYNAPAIPMPSGLGKLRQGLSIAAGTQGTLLRGVVIDVHRYGAQTGAPTRTPALFGMYADVLVYTALPGNSVWRYLPRCLITQAHAGRHDGDIYVPRKNRTGFGTSANPITPEIAKRLDGTKVEPGTSPMMMDGDHVLVGFIDNQPNQPAIVGYIPHPRVDAGIENTATIGERLHMVEADNNPRLVKHQGAYHGVTSTGDFVINTTRAHLGDSGGGTEVTGGGYGEQGAEVKSRKTYTEGAATGVAEAGNMVVNLPPNATLTFNFTDDAGGITNSLSLTSHNGTFTVDADSILLGSAGATEKAVLGDALNKWLMSAAGLSVQTAFGPSGPAINPLTGEAAVDPLTSPTNVLSDTVKIEE